MLLSPPARWLAALPALAALSLSAQEAAPAAANPPAQGLAFESALQGYRRFADAPVQSWQDANDTVGRIGGWRSYAKEAAQPGSPAPAAPEPMSKPAPGTPERGHHGHHGGRP